MSGGSGDDDDDDDYLVDTPLTAESDDGGFSVPLDEDYGADKDLRMWQVRRLLVDLCMCLSHAAAENIEPLSSHSNIVRQFLTSYTILVTACEIVCAMASLYASADTPAKIKEAIRITLIEWIQWKPSDFRERDTKNTVKFLLGLFESTVGGESNAIQQGWSRVSLVTKLSSPRADYVPPSGGTRASLAANNNERYESMIVHHDAQDVAKSMTMLEWRALEAVPLDEFLSCKWNDDRRKYSVAPNLVRLIARHDVMKDWAASQIVRTRDLAARVRTLTKLIHVAHELVRLNNFSSASQLYAGVGHYSCTRLKRTWEKVDAKTRTMYEVLVKLFDVVSNFSAYRECLEKALGGLSGTELSAVPYIAVTLRDLTFIVECNPNYVAQCSIGLDKRWPGQKVLSFDKVMMVGRQLDMIRVVQKRYYRFETNSALDEYFSSPRCITSLSTEDIDRRSKLIEPPLPLTSPPSSSPPLRPPPPPPPLPPLPSPPPPPPTPRESPAENNKAEPSRGVLFAATALLLSPRLTRSSSDFRREPPCAGERYKATTPSPSRRDRTPHFEGAHLSGFGRSEDEELPARDTLGEDSSFSSNIRIDIPGAGEFKSFSIKKTTLVSELLEMMCRKLAANPDDDRVLGSIKLLYAEYAFYVMKKATTAAATTTAVADIDQELTENKCVWPFRKRTIWFMSRGATEKDLRRSFRRTGPRGPSRMARSMSDISTMAAITRLPLPGGGGGTLRKKRSFRRVDSDDAIDKLSPRLVSVRRRDDKVEELLKLAQEMDAVEAKKLKLAPV